MGVIGWIRDRFAAEGMSAADQARWAEARSLADVGELTAQWLEGRIASQPSYYGPVDVDEDQVPGLADLLAALCRSGVVTCGSQAGFDGIGDDGARWTQLAAVQAFVAVDRLASFRAALTGTGVEVLECEWSWRQVLPVTLREGRAFTDFGNARDASDLRDEWVGYGVCHPDAVAEIVAAVQVCVYDPEAGRNDRLWPALRDLCR
jgi:hypothetical protein